MAPSAAGVLLRELSAALTDRRSVQDFFDAAVDHYWQHGGRERLQQLTALLCSGAVDVVCSSREPY